MKRPLRTHLRVRRADAKAQMEPLPLVPATWMAFHGNWTFFNRRPIRSRPGWIMAGGWQVVRAASAEAGSSVVF